MCVRVHSYGNVFSLSAEYTVCPSVCLAQKMRWRAPALWAHTLYLLYTFLFLMFFTNRRRSRSKVPTSICEDVMYFRCSHWQASGRKGDGVRFFRLLLMPAFFAIRLAAAVGLTPHGDSISIRSRDAMTEKTIPDCRSRFCLLLKETKNALDMEEAK